MAKNDDEQLEKCAPNMSAGAMDVFPIAFHLEVAWPSISDSREQTYLDPKSLLEHPKSKNLRFKESGNLRTCKSLNATAESHRLSISVPFHL